MRKILFIFVVLSVQLQAQSFVNDGATVYVGSGAILSLGDSVINRGHIANDGELYLSGSWLNEGTYTAGKGRVVLNGSGLQRVNHHAQVFGELMVSGGGDKYFEEDMYISTGVSLVSGRLVALNDARLLLEETASITGGSDQAYVVGELVRKNDSEMHFPVGLMDAYLPVTLTEVEGVNPEVGVRVVVPQSAGETSGILTEISNQQYWMVNTYGSDYQGAMVQLPLNNENFDADLDHVVVAESMGQGDPFRSLGQSGLTGDLVSGLVTSASRSTGQVLALGVEDPEVIPDMNIYNAVSPNGDGKHEFLKIENIEFYPDNTVTIYGKDGREVFEISQYNNTDRIFKGQSNRGQLGNLPSGTYYYIIEIGKSDKRLKGYFLLSR